MPTFWHADMNAVVFFLVGGLIFLTRFKTCLIKSGFLGEPLRRVTTVDVTAVRAMVRLLRAFFLASADAASDIKSTQACALAMALKANTKLTALELSRMPQSLSWGYSPRGHWPLGLADSKHAA